MQIKQVQTTDLPHSGWHPRKCIRCHEIAIKLPSPKSCLVELLRLRMKLIMLDNNLLSQNGCQTILLRYPMGKKL